MERKIDSYRERQMDSKPNLVKYTENEIQTEYRDKI